MSYHLFVDSTNCSVFRKYGSDSANWPISGESLSGIVF